MVICVDGVIHTIGYTSDDHLNSASQYSSIDKFTTRITTCGQTSTMDYSIVSIRWFLLLSIVRSVGIMAMVIRSIGLFCSFLVIHMNNDFIPPERRTFLVALS